jgi:hypothetical protein
MGTNRQGGSVTTENGLPLKAEWSSCCGTEFRDRASINGIAATNRYFAGILGPTFETLRTLISGPPASASKPL